MVIGLIQAEIRPYEVRENLKMYERRLAKLKDAGAGLALLPEFFSCGNTLEPKLLKTAIKSSGYIKQWLWEQAKALDMIICGSFPSLEQGHVYNRFAIQEPGAELTGHLKNYIPVAESIYSKESDNNCIIETSFGKAGLIICAESFVPKILLTDFSDCSIILLNFAIPNIFSIMPTVMSRLTKIPALLAKKNGVPVALCGMGGRFATRGSIVAPIRMGGVYAGRSGVYLPSGVVAGPLLAGEVREIVAEIPLGPGVATPDPRVKLKAGLPLIMRAHDYLFKAKAEKIYSANLTRWLGKSQG